jgi:UDP-4-amino-4-deoxy-L-arabinose formyltransferase / UDP-glucuronic acid dehydrogenase (UDP-4-keto-hexauronic acid decarboxylating)
VDDGISGLMKILENRDGRASGRIFNLGNPGNDCSIRDLALLLQELYARHSYGKTKKISGLVEETSQRFYGEGYQDIQTRTPSIRRAQEILGWNPKVGLRGALSKTLDAFIAENRPRRKSAARR